MQRVAQVLLPFIIFLRARWRPSSSGRQSAMKETERNIIAGRGRRKTRLLLEKFCLTSRWRHAAFVGLRWALEPPPREGACLWFALGTQAFPDERKNLAGAGGGGASVRASSQTRQPLLWPGLGPAGGRRGAGR